MVFLRYPLQVILVKIVKKKVLTSDFLGSDPLDLAACNIPGPYLLRGRVSM